MPIDTTPLDTEEIEQLRRAAGEVPSAYFTELAGRLTPIQCATARELIAEWPDVSRKFIKLAGDGVILDPEDRRRVVRREVRELLGLFGTGLSIIGGGSTITSIPVVGSPLSGPWRWY